MGVSARRAMGPADHDLAAVGSGDHPDPWCPDRRIGLKCVLSPRITLAAAGGEGLGKWRHLVPVADDEPVAAASQGGVVPERIRRAAAGVTDLNVTSGQGCQFPGTRGGAAAGHRIGKSG